MLIAMALVMGAGGSWENYMEQYDMMDDAWLSNGCSDPNMEIISCEGRNLRWAQMTHAAEGIADGRQREVDGADMLAWWNVPRVHVLGACEKGKGFLHDCRVRVPAGEISAEDDGVRGFMVDIKEKTPGEDMEVCLLGVQVLLACEKRVSGIEATEIQIHGSRQDGGFGACEMEFNLTKMQWGDDHGEQCIELATPHNSTWRKSFGPWKAEGVSGIGEHAHHGLLWRAWMAWVKVFMEKFMDLMTHDREPHVVLLDCGFGGMYVGEPLGPCCKDIFKDQIKTETTWSTKASNEIAVENLVICFMGLSQPSNARR